VVTVLTPGNLILAAMAVIVITIVCSGPPPRG